MTTTGDFQPSSSLPDQRADNATSSSRAGTPASKADIEPATGLRPLSPPSASPSVYKRASPPNLAHANTSRPYFHSRKIKKGEFERPFTKVKDPREKWVTLIPLIGIFVGLAISGYMVYDGLRSVVTHTYCVVYKDDFSTGFNTKVWTKEAEVGGFGNGQFEETTITEENVYVQDGMLFIKPTLQNAKLIESNSTINLLQQGICTSNVWSDCITGTNTTNHTIVNPVKSGRINTKKGAAIKYGRIEVVAKFPAGDWLWPAIWLLPVNSTYGLWPASGEIDIAESRGNNHTYTRGGNNIVSSALHWGPNSANDAWWRTNVRRSALHTTFAKTFHTFGLEWSEKYLFTYLDTRLLQVLYNDFNEPLWQRGKFPLSDSNGTRSIDPWSQTGRDSTPFDQDFYLILNVAVGGTNGWFQDGEGGKPWVDNSPTARRDFWIAKDQWYPTWEGNGQMIVKSVKIWQQEGYNGC